MAYTVVFEQDDQNDVFTSGGGLRFKVKVLDSNNEEVSGSSQTQAYTSNQVTDTDTPDFVPAEPTGSWQLIDFRSIGNGPLPSDNVSIKNSLGLNSLIYLRTQNGDNGFGSFTTALTNGSTKANINWASLSTNGYYFGFEPPGDGNTNPPVRYWGNFTNLCFIGTTMIKLQNGNKMIKDLVRGDIVMTDNGPQPLAVLKKVNCVGARPFVKIPKDCFGKNLPSEDIFCTKEHPFAIKKLSQGKKDNEYLHLRAADFIKIKNSNIKKEMVKTEAYYNLIFDDHHIFDVHGLKALSHHPNSYWCGIEKYQSFDIKSRTDFKYADGKTVGPKYTSYEELMENKPEKLTELEYFGKLLEFKKIVKQNINNA